MNNVAGAIITMDPIVMLDCAGDQNGQVQYDITYESGFANPPSIIIVDGMGLPVANGSLVAGDYCLTILDDNDCLAGEFCFEVVEPDPIIVSVTPTNMTCDDGGTIILSVTGGTGDYTYDWADVVGDNDDANRTNLAAGEYTVTVYDTNDCSTIVDDIVIGLSLIHI